MSLLSRTKSWHLCHPQNVKGNCTGPLNQSLGALVVQVKIKWTTSFLARYARNETTVVMIQLPNWGNMPAIHL